MRIGYFIPGWPPDKVPNGIVASLERLGDALEQLGHEVYFLTPQIVDGAPDHRVSVISSRTRSGLMERLRWKFDFERMLYNQTASAIRDQLHLLLLEKRIEIFEMEETFGWVNMVAKALPIPVVTRLHGPWFTQVKTMSQQKTSLDNRSRIDREGLAIRSSFAVSAPSQAVLTSAQSFYGKFSGLSKVIPNPIPLPAYDKVWSYELCDKSMILFVGRFDNLKGADIALRAFSDLVETRPNLQLKFVGPDTGVTMQCGKLVHLSEFIQNEVSIEAASRINYVGTLPRSEVDSLRRMAALTIVASRYENFPSTVSEAMAIGSPIVATSVGGIPEMLKNQRNAILIQPESSEALASACLTLIDNPQLAIRLARQARTDCSENLHPEIIAQQFVKFYGEVIEKFSLQKLRN